jgi:hypothetical protein
MLVTTAHLGGNTTPPLGLALGSLARIVLEPLVRGLGQPARGPLSPARPPDVLSAAHLASCSLALALGGLGARVWHAARSLSLGLLG